MSKHHIEKVTCPSCHHEGDFEVWDSINTVLDPEMKEKVLNQSNSLSVVARSLYPASTSRSAQTGQTVPFTRALITDFHSLPHLLQCHHTFFLDFALTSFGFRGKFFSDHSSAICGCVLLRSFFPLINV